MPEHANHRPTDEPDDPADQDEQDDQPEQDEPREVFAPADLVCVRLPFTAGTVPAIVRPGIIPDVGDLSILLERKTDNG